MYERAADIAASMNGGATKYTLKPKEIGGSSLYAYVDEGARRLGLWLPPNASTWIPEGLKRALGYEDVDAFEGTPYRSDCGSWDFPSVGSYRRRWDLKCKNFKRSLALLAEHVRASGQTMR